MSWQLEGVHVVDMFDNLGLLAHALASSSLLPEQQREDVQQVRLYSRDSVNSVQQALTKFVHKRGDT